MSPVLGQRSIDWKASALFLLTLGFLTPVLALAADTTPPTTPVVTDDGTYTTSTTSLHATWTSSDPESGIAEYQYLIRQDSTSGTILVNWTSTGTTASVTRTGLSLLQGKTYYIGVKAKNGAALWSSTAYSNGIKVDTTAPSAPGLPKEGSSTTDYDYDGDGSYPIYWAAASDAESGIAAYQVQEKVGPTGTWTTLTSSRTSTNYSVSGRLDRTTYSYQGRAKNGAGRWGPWSSSSDGILIDKTAPSPVTVTDDGATTASTTQLHARWTPTDDPESGILEYRFRIRRDSTSGPIIKDYFSVGSVTEHTEPLTLTPGVTYFIGIRARNRAGTDSASTYSDGITVDTTDTASTIQAFQEAGGQVVMEAERYDQHLPRNSRFWTVGTSTTGYSGTSYLAALPNSGANINTGYATTSPELRYNIMFSTTGMYYVWVRGYAANGSDDSIHAGIDGTAPASADRINIGYGSWKWSRTTLDASAPATITVSTPGLHVLNLWMREDGLLLDKVLLRTSSSSTAPSGSGPAESPRVPVNVVDTTPPTMSALILQPGQIVYVGETLTVSASVTDTDPSPLEFQFVLDGVIVQPWGAPGSFSRAMTSADFGRHRIEVRVRDTGGQTQQERALYVYRRPAGPPP